MASGASKRQNFLHGSEYIRKYEFEFNLAKGGYLDFSDFGIGVNGKTGYIAVLGGYSSGTDFSEIVALRPDHENKLQLANRTSSNSGSSSSKITAQYYVTYIDSNYVQDLRTS